MGVMNGSSRSHSPIVVLARLGWLAFVLAVGLFPTRALAITNYDIAMRKDGVVTGAPKSECMIVADFTKPTFSTSDGATFRLIPGGTFKTVPERDGSATQVQAFPTVTADYAPPADKATRNLGGWFQLDYPNGVLDSRGNYHNLHIRFSQIGITYRQNATAKGLKKVRQAVVQLQNAQISAYAFHHMLFNPSNNKSLGWAYQNDKKALTVATKMKASVWYDDSTGTTPNLLYNLYGWDLDIYDRVNYNSGTAPEAWRDVYAEHIEFSKDDRSAGTDTVFSEMDGDKGVIHVQSNTKLQVTSRRISGTASDDGTLASGFSTSLVMGTSLENTGFKFWWVGSRCGTSLFKDFTYSLATRTGAGGHAWICAGTGEDLGSEKPDIESLPGVIALDEAASSESGYVAQRTTGTIPRNDYNAIIIPEPGYRIAHIDLDGIAIGEDGTAQGATDFAGAAVSFDENGWAHVGLANMSRDHVIHALFTREPTGSLGLKKQSSAPAITQDNACYSLEGAHYGVYADEGCQELVGELSTDAEGSTSELELPLGTYYVRETTASKGYLLDTETHEVVVREDEPCVLEVSEIPATAAPDIRIQKRDADTSTAVAQGSASLVGAEFSIDYYDVSAASLEELPAEPRASWVVTTDARGVASLSSDGPVSGSDLFVVDGKPVMPLGTVVIREVKAPEGYLVSRDAIVGVTRYDLHEGKVSSAAVVGPDLTESTADDPVVRGGIKVKKAGPDGQGLSDACFEVVNASPGPVIVDAKAYQPGDVCLTLVTGDDGTASCGQDALPYGSYVLREARAPKGYRRDQSWKKEFAIAKDAQVVDLSAEPLINEPLACSASLAALKRFDGASQGRSLEEGMFSFTLYDASGTALDTQTNDAEGNVSFRKLSFGYDDLGKEYTYTIKEDAGDDEEVVYDNHAETVRVGIGQDDHGELFCNVTTDDDGVVFSNRTVDRVKLPLTGMDGTHAVAATTVIAMVLGGLVGRRAFGMRL